MTKLRSQSYAYSNAKANLHLRNQHTDNGNSLNPQTRGEFGLGNNDVNHPHVNIKEGEGVNGKDKRNSEDYKDDNDNDNGNDHDEDSSAQDSRDLEAMFDNDANVHDANDENTEPEGGHGTMIMNGTMNMIIHSPASLVSSRSASIYDEANAEQGDQVGPITPIPHVSQLPMSGSSSSIVRVVSKTGSFRSKKAGTTTPGNQTPISSVQFSD